MPLSSASLSATTRAVETIVSSSQPANSGADSSSASATYAMERSSACGTSCSRSSPARWSESFCSSLKTWSIVKKFVFFVVRRASMSLNMVQKIW